MCRRLGSRSPPRACWPFEIACAPEYGTRCNQCSSHQRYCRGYYCDIACMRNCAGLARGNDPLGVPERGPSPHRCDNPRNLGRRHYVRLLNYSRACDRKHDMQRIGLACRLGQIRSYGSPYTRSLHVDCLVESDPGDGLRAPRDAKRHPVHDNLRKHFRTNDVRKQVYLRRQADAHDRRHTLERSVPDQNR